VVEAGLLPGIEGRLAFLRGDIFRGDGRFPGWEWVGNPPRRELAVVLRRGKNPDDGFIDDLGYQESSLVVGVMVVAEVVSMLF
jgi:hypothetical protein